MTTRPESRLPRLFRFLLAKRWWIAIAYALILGPSIFFALKVPQDNSLDRLIVQTDPDYVDAHAFEKVFGGGEYVVLLAEAPDPYTPAVLGRVDALEQALAKLPHVQASSVLSVFRRTRAGFTATPEQAEAFRRFATGTELFRRQGLLGKNFLAIPLVLDIHSPAQRHQVVEAIDQAIRPFADHLAPLQALRKVGRPYVDTYLDDASREAGLRYFPLFGLFVVILNLTLYRSLRTLIAFILTLGVTVSLTVGFIGLTGGVFTIVSSLVPMTILITTTATLVYLHSRFVERPPDRPVLDHHIFALTNKFLACTASIFATAVGFAALAVSDIRPIREMGVWVAVGLGFTWVTVFTLFPALQRILRTPTEVERRVAGQWFQRLTAWLPLFSYRWRWVLVPSALLLSAAGAVALFGIPGLFPPMRLQTRAIDYVNHDTQLYKDTVQLEKVIAGLSVTEVWLKSDEFGAVTEPEVLRGLDAFQRSLEAQPQVGAAVSLTSVLRTIAYASGAGDSLPKQDAGLELLAAQVESRLSEEPMLQRFVDKQLSQTHVTVITRIEEYAGFQALADQIRARWKEAVKAHPALAPFELRTAGPGPLAAKISFHLVPTLVESFGLTVAIIFGTFLLVFRNGAARLMAMIPSLFAILVMFGVMRLTSMSLNIATILIASTVLGTSENDQIHFFYHFLEKRKDGSTEDGLRHTMTISGRAIFFATLINAGGFLAFALATLPPVRQFGILSSLAFLLSMIADFTALPAALWMVFRDRPDSLKVGAESSPGRPRDA